MKPTFFKSGSEFRAWLETHHRSAKELLVGFYKKGSGIPSITYPEADKKAWAFYHGQAPWYQRTTTHLA